MLEVWRGCEMVARVLPPSMPQGVPIQDLNRLFGALPKLGADADSFRDDLQELDNSLIDLRDPWAS